MALRCSIDGRIGFPQRHERRVLRRHDPLWKGTRPGWQAVSGQAQPRPPIKSRWSLASRLPQLAICTLAAPAPRCSTGSSRAITAAGVLSIEDTDRKRSTQDAIDKIIEGRDCSDSITTLRRCSSPTAPAAMPRWHRNSSRRGTPTNATLRLRNSRRCARSSAPGNWPLRYDRRWRDRDTANAPAGAGYVIRLKVPTEGETRRRRRGPGWRHRPERGD